jgi:hypothetical protein
MMANTSQTRKTLGQLCTAIMELQIMAGCDTAWIRTRVSLVMPKALRCNALNCCTTRLVHQIR